jgi:chromosome partitioning protein
MKEEKKRKCRVCGCTEGDCRKCIEKTGKPCYWVEEDLCSACKTTVVSFVSIKGGTGKTNIAICLGKALAAAKKRVLLIDSDLNNSLSFHFISEDEMERTKELNIAAALSNETNNLCDYMVPTITPGVDIIASTPYLADLRTLSEKRLKRMIPTLYGKFDILIIDCPPTYDNIVLNAVNASDYTITPVLKDLFSYNAVEFLAGVLPRDIENFKNWFVLINGYDKRFEEAKTGRQNDFLELYRKREFPLTPVETWFPWTTQIHLLVDYHKSLTCAKGNSGAVYNPDLYRAVTELAGCFCDEELQIPEVF